MRVVLALLPSEVAPVAVGVAVFPLKTLLTRPRLEQRPIHGEVFVGQGLSPVTINHDLKLLRKMLNWGIRKGYLEKTPSKSAPRRRSHLRGKRPATGASRLRATRRSCSTPATRTCVPWSRPCWNRVSLGEILSLQWQDVNVHKREITIRAEKSKTRTSRLVPISTRLASIWRSGGLIPRAGSGGRAPTSSGTQQGSG